MGHSGAQQHPQSVHIRALEGSRHQDPRRIDQGRRFSNLQDGPNHQRRRGHGGGRRDEVGSGEFCFLRCCEFQFFFCRELHVRVCCYYQGWVLFFRNQWHPTEPEWTFFMYVQDSSVDDAIFRVCIVDLARPEQPSSLHLPRRGRTISRRVTSFDSVCIV